MAYKLVSPSRRVIVYLPSLQSAVAHFRSFSSCDEPELQQRRYVVREARDPAVWPDQKLGPFAPKSSQFNLPEHTGLDLKRGTTITFDFDDRRLYAHPKDLLDGELPNDRHADVIGQMDSLNEIVKRQEIVSKFKTLECIAHECPELMKKDFKDLFPRYRLNDDDSLTVITLCQKTKHDMSGWSSEVEQERETLLQQFVEGASNICKALKSNKFWADFIDPASGRPYLSDYTSATMFETDERYRKLGFTIEDLGCCKVISHHLWGTNSFVGCIFTDAPVDDPVIQRLTRITFNKDSVVYNSD